MCCAPRSMGIALIEYYRSLIGKHVEGSLDGVHWFPGVLVKLYICADAEEFVIDRDNSKGEFIFTSIREVKLKDAVLNDNTATGIKVGDKVEATFDGATWFPGVLACVYDGAMLVVPENNTPVLAKIVRKPSAPVVDTAAMEAALREKATALSRSLSPVICRADRCLRAWLANPSNRALMDLQEARKAFGNTWQVNTELVSSTEYKQLVSARPDKHLAQFDDDGLLRQRQLTVSKLSHEISQYIGRSKK